MCGRTFNTKLGRSVHERTVHGSVINPRKTDFICPNCKKLTYFDSALSLQIHLEEYHGLKSETLELVKKRSFENMIYLFDAELHKIHINNIIGGVLDDRELSRLIREGILVIEKHGRMGKPTIYALSESALQILREISENK